MKKPPDFIIAGSPKCGSFLLYNLLDQHPLVDMSKNKEPNLYYKNWGKDLTLEQFQSHNKNLRGEASVGYFNKTEVPERIKKINPNTRLIFCLRNPVERVYSHYWHRVKGGFEDRRWRDILEKSNAHEYLFSYSMYSRNVNYYLKEFPKKQIQFFDLELYKSQPEFVFSKILSFLELPKAKVESKNVIINKGKSYKSLTLQKIFSKIKTTRTIVPKPMRKFLIKPYRMLERVNERRLDVNELSNNDYHIIADILKEDCAQFQKDWNGLITKWPI